MFKSIPAEVARTFNRAVTNEENLNEDGSINWDFVQADFYIDTYLPDGTMGESYHRGSSLSLGDPGYGFLGRTSPLTEAYASTSVLVGIWWRKFAQNFFCGYCPCSNMRTQPDARSMLTLLPYPHPKFFLRREKPCQSSF